MSRRIILMRGIPGSGKSWIAKAMSNAFTGICSTDDFWYLIGSGTRYAFDPKRLAEAHEWNLDNAEEYLRNFTNVTAIIDNTNINPRDMEPYFDLAVKYNSEVSIVQVDTPLEVCLSRNALRTPDRRIPPHVIERMYSNFHKPVSVGQLLNQAKERAKK